MALIMRYRLEPPESLNQEVYEALCHQVGSVGLNVQVAIGEGENAPQLVMTGQFISVEGEHSPEAREEASK